MNRRLFFAAAGAVLWLAHAKRGTAQQKIHQIGFLTPFPAGWSSEDGFHQGLRELGYVEGKDISIEWRRAVVRYEDLKLLAVELVQAHVDVVVTMATPAARAALDATTTTPIVCLGMANPIGTGLVKSLAKPGGNVTGVATLGVELASKRLDLLRQLAPRAHRIACLTNPANPAAAAIVDSLQSTARSLGIKVETINARNGLEVDGALRAIPWKKIDGLVVLGEPIFLNQGAKIALAVTKAKMPAIFPFREHHEHGVVMSYGPDLRAMLHRGAYYVDKILKGAKPSDLPVEQASKFDLIIDLRVAHEQGIKVPQELLVRADEVIR